MSAAANEMHGFGETGAIWVFKCYIKLYINILWNMITQPFRNMMAFLGGIW
jgi:hypothetical protein